jgi:hypothetical protein
MSVSVAQNVYARKCVRDKPRSLGFEDCKYDRRCNANFLTKKRFPMVCFYLFSGVSSSHLYWVEAWGDWRACIGEIKAGGHCVCRSTSCQRSIYAKSDR